MKKLALKITKNPEKSVSAFIRSEIGSNIWGYQAHFPNPASKFVPKKN